MDGLTALVPPELLVFLIAALPVLEIRGSIPFALGVLGLEPIPALLWSLAGNLLAVALWFKYLDPLSAFLSRHFAVLDRFFNWFFTRTRRRSDLIRRYGPLGLALFVAVPLPVTGGWTGAVAAFLLGLSFWRALPAIALGILVAGIIVTLVVTGVLSLFGF